MKANLLSILTFLFCHLSYGAINPRRQFQLDSITTNINRNIVRNIDSVHFYLNSQAKNDEEKVWMFYGLIATHFKYDNKRKGEKNRPSYSPEYTTKKLSGVCEDFAELFKELCNRSHIPCLVVFGKAKTGFFGLFENIQKIVRLQSIKFNHAWNVVKINGEWKLMDPTWSHIIKVEKKILVTGKTRKNVNIKIVDRSYYEIDPYIMRRDHKPGHPAFLTCKMIPTFKTVFRKTKHQKFYTENYDYSKKLDSIYNNEYPLLSKIYIDEFDEYSSRSIFQYEISKQLIIPFQKRVNPMTINDYEKSLDALNKLSKFLIETYNYDLGFQKSASEVKIKKNIEKLKKVEPKKK